MLYEKINRELILRADEADSLIAELDSVPDVLEERYILFDGGVETMIVEHATNP